MAITPVSAVSYLNSSVGFEGNKKRRKHVSTPILAAAIATSSLNVQELEAKNNVMDAKNVRMEMAAKQSHADKDAKTFKLDLNDIENINDDVPEKQVVRESKTFKGATGEKFIVNVIGDEGLTGKTRKIQLISYVGKYPLELDVEEASIYRYTIASDDGTKGGNFELKAVKATLNKPEDSNSYSAKVYRSRGQLNFTIYNDEVNDYVYSKLFTNNNCTDKIIKIYKNTLRPGFEYSLQNGANGNLIKDAVPKASYGKLLDKQEFEGSNSKYLISFYSTDSNSDDAEVVTLQVIGKDGKKSPNLQVVFNKNNLQAEFPSNESEPRINTYPLTILQGKTNQKYCISDMKLSNLLESVIQQKDMINNAYSNMAGMDSKYKYHLNERGEIIPIMNLADTKTSSDESYDPDDINW